MVDVKGSAITARMRFVRERYGEAAWKRLRAALQEPHQAIVEARVLPHAWVPFSLFVDLNVQADLMFGTGNLALCREMGAYSAEINLPTLYRIFFMASNPRYVMKKAAKVWNVHYTSGQITVEDLKTHLKIRIVDFEEPHRAHCMSVAGWIQRSIELSGGKRVQVAETSCRTQGEAMCEMLTRWES